MKLDPWQEEFIKTKGDKILCCGRQIGKTEICAIDCGDYVQNPDNPHPVLMTAPTERQAFALFDKTLRYLLENYPNSVIKKGLKRPTKSKIELRNGMRIYCLPTGLTGLGIRGLTIGRSYEDENSRTPDEVEEAIAPMLLTTGGARIKLSTPHGAQGEFWRTFINKDGAYNSYTRFSKDSETVIEEREVCESWSQKQREGALKIINQAKKRFSNKQFNQEYMGKFIADLHRWFSDKWISNVCTLERPPIQLPGNYFLGVDIARMGEDSGTYCILKRIDKNNIRQVESLITTKKYTTETFDKICELERHWKFKKIGIDAGSGSLGVGILDFLLKTPILRKKVIAINNVQRNLDSRGERKKNIMKTDLYENLLALGERGVLKLLDDDEIIYSLNSVQYEYVQKEGQLTKLRIFSNPHNASDVVEGIHRAAWLANQKHLNISISWA